MMTVKHIVTDDLTGEVRENCNYITVHVTWRLVSGSANSGGDFPEPMGTFFSYSNALIWTSNLLQKGAHSKRDDNVWAMEGFRFLETSYSGNPSLFLAYDYQWLTMEEDKRNASG